MVSSSLVYLSYKTLRNKPLFSHSIVSNSLWPHGLQHSMLHCPSPSTGACSNSCPLNWWCHPTISSSVVLFYSSLWSFPASGTFLMNRLFVPGGQSIVKASALASDLPMNTKYWFSLGLSALISLQSKGLSRVFPNTTDPKHQSFGGQPSLRSNCHIHTWLLEKPQLWRDRPLSAK